ncbi:peptidase inhibitor family I36 protein [Streptomyces sp. NPDC059533]|uniref:peptidase inhibitor family I36 protein n=1 Tax=unclassified Streptomyces TaxID=2593676 RepID=UPI003693D4B7
MNIKRTVAAAVAAVGITLGLAAPANATICSGGEFCLYYNSNLNGAKLTFDWPVEDLAGYTFDYSGAGGGQWVKNNAASAQNHTQDYAGVYFNSYFSGPFDFFKPGVSGNLVKTYNDNASVDFW